jgi:hypothetical protein
VGRIAARFIEQLVARQPLTMRSLIDGIRLLPVVSPA